MKLDAGELGLEAIETSEKRPEEFGLVGRLKTGLRIMALLAAGVIGCSEAQFPFEPSEIDQAIASDEREFDEAANSAKVPTVKILNEPMTFEMPNSLKGKMSPEEFEKISKKVTDKVIALMRGPLAKLVGNWTKADDRPAFKRNILDFYRRLLQPELSKIDPRIAQDLANRMEFYDFDKYVNLFLKKNGYVLYPSFGKDNDQISLYPISKTNTAVADDGYMHHQFGVLYLENPLIQFSRIGYIDSSIKRMGTSSEDTDEVFIFENGFDPYIVQNNLAKYPWLFFDGDGMVETDIDKILSAMKDSIVAHEAVHQLNDTYHVGVPDMCQALDYSDQKVSLFEIDELSAWGAEMVNAKFPNYDISSMDWEHYPLTFSLLPKAFLYASPPSDFKRGFETYAVTPEIAIPQGNMNDLLKDPNFDSKKAGRWLYATATEMWRDCLAKSFEESVDQLPADE